VVLGLLAAAILAGAAYVLLSAYAPEINAGRNTGANAVSPSAVGYAGIVRLMRLLGDPAAINRNKARIADDFALMVLTPQRPLTVKDLNADHFRLVVLPKWAVAPDRDHAGWVVKTGMIDPRGVAGIIPPRTAQLKVDRRTGPARPVVLFSRSLQGWPAQGVATGPIDALQTISSPGLIPIVTDGQGRSVVAMTRNGRAYVLADPDLIDTQGVRDPATARAIVLLLQILRGHNPLMFDVTLNGIEETHSLLRLALEPPFLGVTLCLLAAAGLVGLQGWNRFGPAQQARRAIAHGKTALAENGAGMVKLARREPRMALRYARLCRERAAAALGAEHLEPQALDDFLDRWAVKVGAQERISTLMAEAAKVRRAGELPALARRTLRWRLEMTREPG
jgi:hypothetical protein